MSARRQLIERSLPLARRLASRYRRDNVALDDLVQVASVGLVKAVDGFDPGRGVAFSTYAVPTITGELKRHFRDAAWSVHLPRATQERVLRLTAVTERVSDELGRAPTPREVAERSEMSPEDVCEALEASLAARLTPLDASDDRDGGPRDRDELGEGRSVDLEEAGFSLVEERDAVARAMSAVTERERLVLRLRFWEELTQSQIAERLGVSQMQVSRVIRRTLDRLRSAAEAQPEPVAAGAVAGTVSSPEARVSVR
jgi:RNA polymerase sigma-B factor